MVADIIIVNGLKYQAVKPVDGYCTACDLKGHDCWNLKMSTSCLKNSREDSEYVNYKLLRE